MRSSHRRPSLAVLGVGLLLCSGTGLATDFRLTGFGTMGYARSFEHDLAYLRYIDHGGTIKTDSLIGIQAEAEFNPQWGTTVQAVASAPRTRDDGSEAKIRWAFLSFRPDNDWLFRLGRIRPPMFINTQNAEVGVTFDQARLPAELYSLSPVYDLDGVALTKTWAQSTIEVTLDGYWGKANIKFRDRFPLDPPATYFPQRITMKGLVLSYSSGPVLLRGGIHLGDLEATGSEQFPRTYTPNTIGAHPPFGGALYLPTGLMSTTDIRVLTLGVDWRSAPWQMTAEYAKRKSPNSDVTVNDQSAYLTIARRFGAWAPYITHARMLTKPELRTIYRDVYNAPVPVAVQDEPFFVSADFHRSLADRLSIFDQYSTMIGASYSVSPRSKIKFEWMRTHVGLVSTLVDREAQNRSFNVLSASYSVAF